MQFVSQSVMVRGYGRVTDYVVFRYPPPPHTIHPPHQILRIVEESENTECNCISSPLQLIQFRSGIFGNRMSLATSDHTSSDDDQTRESASDF